jgi:pimeloyl-ACP methyl ester carboxylesterase
MARPAGLPVVFIHGFGAWSETWKKTTSVLAAQGFHTIALDIPPFGFSEKPADGSFSTQAQAQRIIKVFDTLQLKQVILVGPFRGRASHGRSSAPRAGSNQSFGFGRCGLRFRKQRPI